MQILGVKYDRQSTSAHPGVARIVSLSSLDRDDSWLGGGVCPMNCETLEVSPNYLYKLTHFLRLFLQL